MPNLESLLTPAAARSLMAGGLFLLVWVLAAQAPALLRRILARQGNRRWHRLADASAWPYVGRMVTLVYALGCVCLAFRGAYIAPLDIGWEPLDWRALAPWLPAVAGLTALWAAMLWGATWRDLGPREDASPRGAYGTILGLPAHVIGEEAWAAMLRGGLIPALGLYWGAWAAVLARGPVSLASPGVRRRLGDDAARPFIYLDWGMDWVAAGCFAVSGSLWASLIARAAGHLAANLIHRGLYAWARRRERQGSIEAG